VTAVEIDLDNPAREEIQRTVQYLSVNGLLGKYSELSDVEKLKFIESTCRGQLRDVVLSLYETGALHAKVEELLVGIQALDKEARRLVIFSAVLTQAGYQSLSGVWILSELLDYSNSFEDLRASLRKNQLSDLVLIDGDNLSIKSPALAEFILKKVFNLDSILEVVKLALVNVDKYFESEDDLLKMAKGLLKFSVYGRLIKMSAKIKL